MRFTITRAVNDEHSTSALLFNESLVDEFLISLEHGQRIEAVLGRDIAHRWQRIGVAENTLKYHCDNTISKLSIDRQILIPFWVHRISA